MLSSIAIRVLATLLIVAQQPDGSVLVTADSRVGQLHFRNRVPEATTYRDDGCKITLVNHIVFLYAGEPRHTADLTHRGRIRTTGWDAMALASNLIRHHRGSIHTQQDLDALALRWAQSVEDSESALEQDVSREAALHQPGNPVPPGQRPAMPFQPSTGIFLTSSPRGAVLQSSISIRQQKVGMLIERTPPPSPGPDHAASHLAFYGDAQAQSTAAAAYAQLQARGQVSTLTFDQLEQVNQQVANQVGNVAPPFDQAEVRPGAWPRWVKAKEHCR